MFITDQNGWNSKMIRKIRLALIYTAPFFNQILLRFEQDMNKINDIACFTGCKMWYVRKVR